MLLSAVQQHESAVSMHVFPPSLPPLHSPSPSHHLRSSQSTRLSSFLYSNFPLAIHFTCGNVCGIGSTVWELHKQQLSHRPQLWELWQDRWGEVGSHPWCLGETGGSWNLGSSSGERQQPGKFDLPVLKVIPLLCIGYWNQKWSVGYLLPEYRKSEQILNKKTRAEREKRN